VTEDQIRVRVTVTVTLGDGTQARRSSLVERIVDPETRNRLDNWTGSEVPLLLGHAWSAATVASAEAELTEAWSKAAAEDRPITVGPGR